MKKTGIELIAEERQEQIEKHGHSLEHDSIYTTGQLVQAAIFSETATGKSIRFRGCWPKGWSNVSRKNILSKSKIDALKVAGAFYMAENDRLGENKYQIDIDRIAAEIDWIQA